MSRHKYPGVHPATANVIARLEWASRMMTRQPVHKRQRNVARLDLVKIISDLQRDRCRMYAMCPGCSGKWWVRLRKWLAGYAA